MWLLLCVGTFPALLGAMVLSELISAGGAASPAFIIGFYLSKWMGRGYLAAAGFIGAIGSFISGSVMAGNMTFGAIQKVRWSVLFLLLLLIHAGMHVKMDSLACKSKAAHLPA